MLIDLQVHSTYSDGYLTPVELAKFLAARKIRVVALTDHNTIGGQDEFHAAAKKFGLKTISGLELYIKFHSRRFNLLWYNYDTTNSELHDILRGSQFRRRRKFRRILEKLSSHGFKLKIYKTLDKYNHYVPINRIIDELMAVSENRKKIRRELKTANPRSEEIIRHYFYNREIGILGESYIDLDRIIRLRKKIGGQLILCHPGRYQLIKKDLWKDLKGMGIDGAEILSPHHAYSTIMRMQALARELDFIETGGSDFHLFEGGAYPLQHAGQYFTIESKLLKGINKIIG
jgi:hypothetical protein